jgi:hypothetical protein
MFKDQVRWLRLRAVALSGASDNSLYRLYNENPELQPAHYR